MEAEASFLNCYVCYSSKPMSAVYLKERLIDKGIANASIVKVNSLTFHVNIGDNETWLDSDINILKDCFLKIRKGTEDDLIISRAVGVECIGLPVHAWQEGNLKPFSKKLGTWISWSFQNE